MVYIRRHRVTVNRHAAVQQQALLRGACSSFFNDTVYDIAIKKMGGYRRQQASVIICNYHEI
jgi:hypothetical protein